MEQVRRESAVWNDYALLDCGGGEKCERFGNVIVRRPDPQALWPKADPGGPWKEAHAAFVAEGEHGQWRVLREVPERWELERNGLHFVLHRASFKHVGIFPEQAANWDWIGREVHKGAQVLNLFGYTGGATVAAALAGAQVVHVDASRPSIGWARENAEASGLGTAPIRWLVDDAPAFVAREGRRERRYDMVILDPPAFGRGPSGELWQFERDLAPLLDGISQILAPGGRLLISAYSLGFPAVAIEQVVRASFPTLRQVETVELVLPEGQPRGFVLPAGLAVRACL
jgi:23S rRNA (cytosine1962-C5)-methyltransferase